MLGFMRIEDSYVNKKFSGFDIKDSEFYASLLRTSKYKIKPRVIFSKYISFLIRL